MRTASATAALVMGAGSAAATAATMWLVCMTCGGCAGSQGGREQAAPIRAGSERPYGGESMVRDRRMAQRDPYGRHAHGERRDARGSYVRMRRSGAPGATGRYEDGIRPERPESDYDAQSGRTAPFGYGPECGEYGIDEAYPGGRLVDVHFGDERYGQQPDDLSFFGDRPEIAELPFENRLLTNMRQHSFSTEGLDFDPAVSRDGRHIVFATTRNAERPDICMKRVDGTAITQLTGDPADDVQPRFTPDDSHVVFCSNRSGNWDIWMLEVETSRVTQITRDPADEISPCVSPDGQTVAFSVWGARSGRWEIWTLSLANPGVRRFLAYGMFPDFSPDGAKIAFQRARQRGSRWFSVWVSDIVEGEARLPREVAHSDAFACITPRWSPDGKSIVFCGVRNVLDSWGGGSSEVRSDIWLVSEDGGYRTKMTDGGAAALNPTFGADGRVYFVSTQAGSENIWSVGGGDVVSGSEKLATVGESTARER